MGHCIFSLPMRSLIFLFLLPIMFNEMYHCLFVFALDRFPPATPSAIDQLALYDATQNCVKAPPESDHDSVQSQANASSPEKQIASSLPLVAVPPLNVEAISMVPLHNKPKSKSCQVGQRRIRRPFTVAEVEALVQAVEKLGTGRLVLHVKVDAISCYCKHNFLLSPLPCIYI